MGIERYRATGERWMDVSMDGCGMRMERGWRGIWRSLATICREMDEEWKKGWRGGYGGKWTNSGKRDGEGAMEGDGGFPEINNFFTFWKLESGI